MTATGQVGDVTETTTVGLIGVQATGQVGTEGDNVTVALFGVQADGLAGTVSVGYTTSITGNEATGFVGDVTASIQPYIIEFDYHDGDKKRHEKFEKERSKNKERRDAIIDTFERMVEGKEDSFPPEVVQPYVEVVERIKEASTVSDADINRLLQNIDAMQQAWADHINDDDEEILALL
jgi:hypothetical protein